ncbi:hypothetical protein [Ruminococcus sp. Marseille-P6503]|uniref:hypothetical protein n=1 Tax=Ruminococcus sp. Marseille-P6503 TaxID=2364796 RepID=UPI000F52B0D7|nr:hypothetical protein [Ruminococcus sp. Marseille-P6503]
MEINKIDEMIDKKEKKISELKEEVAALKKKRDEAEQLKIMTLLKANNLTYEKLVTKIKLDWKDEDIKNENKIENDA